MFKMLQGVHVPHRKNTAQLAPVRMPAPALLYYPAVQNIGAPGKAAVKVGDAVKVGSVLFEAGGFVGAPIYSSVSGKVKRIEDTLQPGGAYVPTIIVENDGLMECGDLTAPDVHDYDSFIAAVRASGVVGLGGAGFPTAVKLDVKDTSRISEVVINGAECEPYITSDTRTMIDRADDIEYGIELLEKYLGVKRVIIGIEKNKPEAIASMKKLAEKHSSVEVKVLPSIYPQGGEKVLVYHTTGRIIEEGMLPIDVGCVVLNCTSIAAIGSFVKTGRPLLNKCVTVDGSAVKEPKNVIVPIGTPAGDVFEFCGGFKCEVGKVLYGGPMMGVSVADMNAPVLKQTNALIALNERDAKPKEETACIRCGRCTNSCPFGLAPVSIVESYNKGDMEALRKYKANLCMECGCCSFVCPAGKHLVQQNKLAKAALADYMKKKKEEAAK